jgi:hypothetical protein
MSVHLKYNFDDYTKGNCDYLTDAEKIELLTSMCQDLTCKLAALKAEIMELIEEGDSAGDAVKYVSMRLDSLTPTIRSAAAARTAIATLQGCLEDRYGDAVDIHQQLANIAKRIDQ